MLCDQSIVTISIFTVNVHLTHMSLFPANLFHKNGWFLNETLPFSVVLQPLLPHSLQFLPPFNQTDQSNLMIVKSWVRTADTVTLDWVGNQLHATKMHTTSLWTQESEGLDPS